MDDKEHWLIGVAITVAKAAVLDGDEAVKQLAAVLDGFAKDRIESEHWLMRMAKSTARGIIFEGDPAVMDELGDFLAALSERRLKVMNAQDAKN